MEKPPFSMASVYHTKQAGAIKKETSEGEVSCVLSAGRAAES